MIPVTHHHALPPPPPFPTFSKGRALRSGPWQTQPLYNGEERANANAPIAGRLGTALPPLTRLGHGVEGSPSFLPSPLTSHHGHLPTFAVRQWRQGRLARRPVPSSLWGVPLVAGLEASEEEEDAESGGTSSTSSILAGVGSMEVVVLVLLLAVVVVVVVVGVMMVVVVVMGLGFRLSHNGGIA